MSRLQSSVYNMNIWKGEVILFCSVLFCFPTNNHNNYIKTVKRVPVVSRSRTGCKITKNTSSLFCNLEEIRKVLMGLIFTYLCLLLSSFSSLSHIKWVHSTSLTVTCFLMHRWLCCFSAHLTTTPWVWLNYTI